MARENLVAYAVPLSFELKLDCIDNIPVLVLFILVPSLVLHNTTSRTKGIKEQVLAGVVPVVDVRR